jgi:hypothetical protein
MDITASFSEDWLSESIKLSLGFFHVVFNAITIGIINLSWLIWSLLGSL